MFDGETRFCFICAKTLKKKRNVVVLFLINGLVLCFFSLW